MRRNKQGVRRVATTNSAKSKPKKSKPFSEVGEILGSAVGKMFNLNLSGAGRWLGSGIGQIFGSGDYTLAGPAPSSNILTNAAQIPKFSTTKATNVVCHREYLTDITSTTSFFNRTYRLNPGEDNTFPWLATIAQSYQQYKFHGMIFEFRPLITDFVTSGSPGYLIMATDYNAAEPPFDSKQEMENTEYSASCKPTLNLIHGIECAPSETSLPIKYVRTSRPVTEQQNYDMGSFQLATSNPALTAGTVLGELWVTYCVEFFKPILPNTTGGAIDSFVNGRSTYSNAVNNTLGSVQLYSRAQADGVTVSPSVILFTPNPDSYYQFQIIWQGAAAGAIVYPVVTYANATPVNFYGPSTTGPTNAFQFTPEAGINSSFCQIDGVFRSNEQGTPIAISVSGGGATLLPTAGTCLIFVDQMNDDLVR